MGNRIVIIEDDAAIAQAVQLNLECAEYEVTVFDNGQTAWDALRDNHDYDLALLLEYLRSGARKAFEKSVHFEPPCRIYQTVEYAKEIVSIGNQTGEGWFLTGEMIELIHSGVNNIVCTQPFGCLPNHVVGKGVIKELRKHYPLSNIVAIDYDPGASEVNQLNRIKLMLSTAQKNLKNQKD